jgi:hypothetical protein
MSGIRRDSSVPLRRRTLETLNLTAPEDRHGIEAEKKDSAAGFFVFYGKEET